MKTPLKILSSFFIVLYFSTGISANPYLLAARIRGSVQTSWDSDVTWFDASTAHAYNLLLGGRSALKLIFTSNNQKELKRIVEKTVENHPNKGKLFVTMGEGSSSNNEGAPVYQVQLKNLKGDLVHTLEVVCDPAFKEITPNTKGAIIVRPGQNTGTVDYVFFSSLEKPLQLKYLLSEKGKEQPLNFRGNKLELDKFLRDSAASLLNQGVSVKKINIDHLVYGGSSNFVVEMKVTGDTYRMKFNILPEISPCEKDLNKKL